MDLGFLSGLSQGLAGGLSDARKQTHEDELKREQDEISILHTLATSPDIDESISSKALAGLLSISSGTGRRKKSGIQGWLGAQEGTPQLQQIQEEIAKARSGPAQTPVEAGSPPPSTPAAGAPPPQPAPGASVQGAAAMPQGSFATGNAQPQTPPPAPQGPAAMVGQPPPGAAPPVAPTAPTGAQVGMAPQVRHPLEETWAHAVSGGTGVDRNGQPITAMTPPEAVLGPRPRGMSLASIAGKRWDRDAQVYEQSRQHLMETLTDPGKAQEAMGLVAYQKRQAGQALTPDEQVAADQYGVAKMGEETPRAVAARNAGQKFQIEMEGIRFDNRTKLAQVEADLRADLKRIPPGKAVGTGAASAIGKVTMARAKADQHLQDAFERGKAALKKNPLEVLNPAQYKADLEELNTTLKEGLQRNAETFTPENMGVGSVSVPSKRGSGVTIEELPPE